MTRIQAHIEHLKLWGEVKQSLRFKDITTIRIGGGIGCLLLPKSLSSLKAALQYLQEKELPVKVIGRGSDLVCGDAYFDGCVIRLDRFDKVEIDGERVCAQAGVNGMRLAKELAKKGLSGFEFASAIPGTIGGMTYMNAGAYKSSMSEVLERVHYLSGNEVKVLPVAECDYTYRSSVFQQHPEWIILEVEMKLEHGNCEEIQQLMADRSVRRQLSQPLDKPSAGSCFRNPEGDFSWRFIDGVGLRGYRCGDLQVSEKHPNFMVNIGEAKAEDFVKLTEMIQRKVKEKYGVELKREIELFNC